VVRRSPRATTGSVAAVHADRSPTYGIDLQLEQAAFELLSARGAPVLLRTEDSPARVVGDHAQAAVLLDPLDGSTNFAHGLPHYAVSLAVGDLSLGRGYTPQAVHTAVVLNIATGEEYTALRGQEARCNGVVIRPSEERSLKDAIVATYPRHAPAGFSDFIDRTQSIRVLGAAALEVCGVADGRLDAFIDIRDRLTPYDVAAAALIAESAGAPTDVTGARARPDRVSIVCCNSQRLFSEIRSELRDLERAP